MNESASPLDMEILRCLSDNQVRRKYLRVTRRALWQNATRHTPGTERLRNKHVQMLSYLCTLVNTTEWPALHRTYSLALSLPGWQIAHKEPRRQT